eukprot:g6214.t1
MSTLNKSTIDDEIVRKTTLREVKTLRSLQHSNIVTLREAFRRKGKLFLVFEYVEKNLLEVLEENPSGLELEENPLKDFAITPEKTRGRLKLCDFGFARQLPAKIEVSLTDYVSTRWYRSPELLLGSGHYSTEVDLWAIGCIMAELIDGQPLFPGDSDIDQLYIIQKLLGPLTVEQTKLFFMNGRFAGFKFPDMSRHLSLESKYNRKLDADAIDFLKGLLEMDPQRRLTASACLQHSYLACLETSARLRPDTSLKRVQSKPTSLRTPQTRSLARTRHGLVLEDTKKREPPPSDDDSTLSISTRVTIELESNKTTKGTSRKRAHIGKGSTGAGGLCTGRERAKVLPPTGDEGSRFQEHKNLNGLKPIGYEKPLLRRNDPSNASLKVHMGCKENGLILQTPNVSYHAPLRGCRDNAEGLIHCTSIGRNSMLALNSENPSCVQNRANLPLHLTRDRRLATRHGFPTFNAHLAVENEHKVTPLSQETERWKRQPRHSISSQGRIPISYSLPAQALQCGSRKLHPILLERS